MKEEKLDTLALAVDHAIVAVADLGKAARAYAALGFTVTPETAHSTPMGTANRCIMLEESYIELITVLAETPLNAGWRQALARGGGVRGLALASRDIAAERAALVSHGVPAGEVLAFSRAVDEKEELRFRVVRIAQTVPADLRLLVCRHDTPALLWNEAEMDHPNGARRLTGVALQSENPGEARTLLRRLSQALPAAGDAQATKVRVGATPGQITVSVADRDMASRIAAAGFPYAATPGGFVIDLTAEIGARLAIEIVA